MTARELLQRMCPMGVFDDWSNEEVLGSLLMHLRDSTWRRFEYFGYGLGKYHRN